MAVWRLTYPGGGPPLLYRAAPFRGSQGDSIVRTC